MAQTLQELFAASSVNVNFLRFQRFFMLETIIRLLILFNLMTILISFI